MSLIRIGSLTDEGIAALYRHLYSHPAPILRGVKLDIFGDPALCQPVAGAGFIDTDLSFGSTLDLIRHIWAALEPVIQLRGVAAVLEDRGINAFLNAAYIDRLTQRVTTTGGRTNQQEVVRTKIKEPNAHILNLEMVDGERTRHYRNTLFVNLLFYSLYRHRGTLAVSFLTTRIGELTNPMERLAQRVSMMFSAGAWELIEAMTSDPARPGNYYHPRRDERCYLNPSNAVQDVVTLIFSQCSLNFDVEAMSAADLFRLIPATPHFEYWRNRAGIRLGLIAAPVAAVKAVRKRRILHADQQEMAA